MKTRTRISIITASVLMLTMLMAGTAMAGSFLNVPLNNDTAEEGLDCPAIGGPYWHFVISPNNGESYFITFHLNLGDAATYDTSIYVPNGSQLDNVFVAVPSGKTLTSLIKTGSSADIFWSGEGSEPAKFQLSHLCSGSAEDLTVSKSASPSYTRTFDWDISKLVEPPVVYSAGGGESESALFTIAITKDAGTDSDWVVSGTISVHNPNEVAVNGVSLVDSTPGGVCIVTPASVDVPALGEAFASYTCSFSSNPGSGTNTVTATWPDIGSPHTSGSGTAGYVFGSPTTVINGVIDVVDSNGGSWQFSDSGSVSYSMSYSDPAGVCTEHVNIATITQLDKSASATVTDCQGADLLVEKTAFPAFTREYFWGITKDVDKTYVKQAGGSATFNYTVTVFQTGIADKDWMVSGVITVINPNDWQDIVFDLSDVLPGAVCTIDGGIGVLVAKSSSVDIAYSCTFAAQPAYYSDLVNVASATWNAAAYHTPNGSASGEATFQFTLPDVVINKIVTVTDSYAGLLGSVTGTDAEPWAVEAFNYSRTVSVPSTNCVEYPNTATIVEIGLSASRLVRVCGPLQTGALTMGFWQNKNGQALIKNAGVVEGTSICKLTPFLRQFAPFQDLAASSTCSAVATYVTNVIKAANASGASMNAMLKAQMLASSLDVYFKGIGGVLVDLTYIKAGGGYQDVSAAFGGATSLTISQMLAYAASQSNAGGSVWYGNVKSMQELAKNAFDAINNQWVFAP